MATDGKSFKRQLAPSHTGSEHATTDHIQLALLQLWIESTVIRELLRKNSVIKTRGGKRVTHRIVAVSLCIACRRNATQHAVLQPNEGINTLALILAAGPQGDKGSCQAQDDVDAQMWAMLRGLRYVYALKVCRARPA